MGIRKLKRNEFSFVRGFGDSIRPGVDFGFPSSEAAHLRQTHPNVEVVWNVDIGLMSVYAVKEHGVRNKRGDHEPYLIVAKLFDIGDPSECWRVRDQLDYARWRANKDREAEDWQRELDQWQAKGPQEAADEIVNPDLVDQAADAMLHLIGEAPGRIQVPTSLVL